VVHVEDAGQGRGIGAGDDQPGMARDQHRGRLLRHAGCAAQQENAESFARAGRGQHGREVAARHPLAQGGDRISGQGDDGLAVRDDQVGLQQDALQFGVLGGLHEEVHVGGGQAGGRAVTHTRHAPREGLREGDVVEGDAEQHQGARVQFTMASPSGYPCRFRGVAVPSFPPRGAGQGQHGRGEVQRACSRSAKERARATSGCTANR
jgi:hypothetical protein